MILKSDPMSFLGVFVKLRKTTVNFVMSVCLSVCTSAWDYSPVSDMDFVIFYSGDLR
jgi:hypothetical protein